MTRVRPHTYINKQISPIFNCATPDSVSLAHQLNIHTYIHNVLCVCICICSMVYILRVFFCQIYFLLSSEYSAAASLIIIICYYYYFNSIWLGTSISHFHMGREDTKERKRQYQLNNFTILRHILFEVYYEDNLYTGCLSYPQH